jgi:hypothetical protein
MERTDEGTLSEYGIGMKWLEDSEFRKGMLDVDQTDPK